MAKRWKTEENMVPNHVWQNGIRAFAQNSAKIISYQIDIWHKMIHAIPNYHAWVVSVIQYSVIHKWVSNGLPRCVPAWIALASAAGPWQLPTLEAVTSAQTGPIDKMPTNSNKFHTILAISTGFQSHALPSNSSSGRRFDGPISIFWGILESLAARAAGLFKDSFSSRSFCT